MKQIIRWPGLVAFVAIVGGLSALVILFLDFWLKLAAEKSLQMATGAEVNIDRAEHSFSPFGISFYQIQLTDPQAPELNKLEIAELQANIELSPLLLRKVIIDELNLVGVQFGTKRQSVGQVYRHAEEAADADATSPFSLPDRESLPSVDEVLAKSPLKTTRAIEQAQQSYQLHKAKLSEQYATLPDKQKLADYQQRISALSKTEFKDPAALLAAKQEFDQLKQEIKADKQRFKDFKTELQVAKQELSPKLAALKAAPGEDYEQLKALVAGDAAAIGDVTTMVFGEKAAKWTEYALSAFEMVAPMLENKKQQTEQQQQSAGRYISFDDNSGLPEFWVKKALISLSWQQEQIDSQWQDITYQHDVLGRPTLFTVDSKASSLWQSFRLNGDFWLNDSGVDAKQNWQLQGLKLTDMSLIDDNKLSSKLLSGLLSSSGKVSVSGNQLDGGGTLQLASLAMQASGTNKITNIIANTLSQLSQLTIDTTVGGTLDNMALGFSSDLNQQLSGALLASVGKEEQAKLDELKQKLNSKMQGALGTQEGQFSEWLDWEEVVDGNLGNIEDMLNAKMNDVLDSKKDELKDKLKNKLFGN